MAPFAERLLRWFDTHGRHDLPWQHPRAPYRVWLSEIMLQQTQVATVIPYFERFLQRFPDVASLAAAPVDDVLALWAGLGYYARARNLHRCAQVVMSEHGGEFPRDIELLQSLPGIGRSTAAAILSQAHGDRHAILDGNVRRVLSRHAAIEGWPGAPALQKKLWALSESLLPQARLADYTQAIMDLGASVCATRKPACAACPLNADCQAYLQNRVAQIPGPKPKRERPERRTQVLLIENARGELLLERRPPAGIWGGLWCLPLVDEGADWRSACLERYGLEAGDAQALPPLHHAFTHFDLELRPLRLRASATTRLRESTELAWTRMGDPNKGLPAPIRKLLDAQGQTPLFETAP
ncbi:A/G-specific adenine glycosylase [Solimonas sp. K1W22B-7]|nr:A/G-specific adenine glycosylase [Solimonas sp. K1W22B-7]